VGVCHSSVVEFHGLSPTFSPCFMLQKRLMMNGICAMPSAMAAQRIQMCSDMMSSLKPPMTSAPARALTAAE
jgi:hypothetical protein